MGILKSLNEGHAEHLANGPGIIKRGFSAIAGAVGYVAGGVGKAVNGVGYMAGRAGLKTPLKFAAIGTGVVGAAAVAVAATVGGVAWMSSKRNSAAKESQRDLQEQQTNAMRAEVTSMQGTMMGLPPKEGDHARRVLASRNGGMGGVDISNPAVNMPYEAVRS